MEKTRLLSVVCACLVVVSYEASAALVSDDWQTSGDNLITRDADTGLEWLDLTVTVSMTYNDVTAELGVGGLFEGWEYASNAQVIGLFDSAGGTAPYPGDQIANAGAAETLLTLWGTLSGSVITGGASRFITNRLSGPGNHAVGLAVYIPANPDPGGLLMVDNLFLPDDDLGVYINETGSALVRVSAVPVPVAVWLFGSGLLGLIGIARRKKAA